MSKKTNSSYYFEKWLNKHIAGYKQKSKKAKRRFQDKMTPELYNKINPYVLKKTGLKKYDYITCTEPGENADNLFSYKSFNQWDKENWLFQKNAFLENSNIDDKASVIKRFGKTHQHLYLHGSWFRWFYKSEYANKREFQYATLYSVANYVLEKLDVFMDEWLSKCIPNEDVRSYGKSWSKLIKKGRSKGLYRIRKSETRAGGLEKELKKLTKLRYDYYQTLSDYVHQETKVFDGMVFMQYCDEYVYTRDEINVDVLIGGVKAAEKISFRSFFIDLHELKQPFGLIDNKIEEIKIYLQVDVFPKFELQAFGK